MTLYSPSHEGGTLHLPSPTHFSRFDATSTLNQLRRSLSRSPSKSPAAYRLVHAKSPSSQSPLSPSPLSPHRHVSRLQLPGIASRNDVTTTPPASTSPLGLDMAAHHRTTRLSARKYSPLRNTTTSRPHHTARTPGIRRILGESSGNTVVPSLLVISKPDIAPSAPYQQSSVIQPPTIEFKGFGQDTESSLDDRAHAKEHGLPPIVQDFNFLSDKHPAHLTDTPVKSSPLKRPDAPSRNDPSEGASPSAKRRSLHGTSDFDIFDQSASLQSNATGRAGSEYVPTMSFDGTHAPSPISKRANSLRRSTLQQRHHDRPSLSRARANSNLALDFSSGTPAAPTRRPTERNLPTRRNLFSLDGNQAPAAAPTVDNDTVVEPPRAPARHPLSRTVTQSSSGSEMAQDSPTHIPLRVPDKKRLQGAFARSLPIGLPRNQILARQTSGSSDGSDVTTPMNYKMAKPTQAPFMSTGLISKRTKHLQDEMLGNQKSMPDTPCKRPMPINPMGATPAPAPRHTQLRRGQHSFGSPSTPFGTNTSRPSDGSVGKGVGIFGSSIKPLNRRGSFISADSEETPSGEISLSQSIEAQASPSRGNDLRSARDISSFNPKAAVFAPNLFLSRDGEDDFIDDLEDSNESPKCKLILSSPDGLNLDADGDSMMQESPSAYRRFSSLGAIVSYSSHRRPSILKGDHSPSPSPHSRKSHTLPHIRTSHLNLTDARSSVAPVSPLFERSKSPRTPADLRASVAPPDPSGLSISGHANQNMDFRKSTFGASISFGSSMGPPATPTTNRESRFQSTRSMQTSSHAVAEAQVDPSLTNRFDQIEMIGEGEFSFVLKVSAKDEVFEPSAIAQYDESFSTNATISPAKTPKRRVYAVKKARHPYKSRQDRLNKLKEVQVLGALGVSDHTISLQDHWEHDSYLYIQTEFCDEGSLDKFLIDAGRAARLDDFRIWKILFETGLGLKYIHDSGFIHLDLKPANILITFEGTLKIADFGMATPWPAQRGIEGEGDREYIGPEILMGKYDKPADIYALGLIMLEIAANVVLPDNGESWQRLRTGDMSDVPSLTSAPDITVQRDLSGRAIEEDELNPVQPERVECAPIMMLETPPDFMASREHPHSLDNMVSWMINPDPAKRPVIDEMLGSAGVQWVAERRRAGAAVYEGTWGPADEILAQDAEMIDV